MSPNSDTLSWFRANKSLLFLLGAACLAEKQRIQNFIVFGLTRSGLEHTIYRTRGEYANHYTTNVVDISSYEYNSNNLCFVINLMSL
jgi:hypothetical protein